MIEGVQPIVAADGHKASRGQTEIQNFRYRFANPIQVWLVSLVVEGKHQQQTALHPGGVLGHQPAGQEKRQYQQERAYEWPGEHPLSIVLVAGVQGSIVRGYAGLSASSRV